MWSRIKRLFVIKTKLEAFIIIYALALGAVERGRLYIIEYPGVGGWLLFGACTCAVFMAGAKILDAVAAAQARSLRPGGLPDRRGVVA